MENTDKTGYVQTIAKKLNFECDIFCHELSGKTTADAERALGIESRFIIKSLLLKSKNGEYVAAIIRGCDRVNFKALESISGLKDLRFANLDEIRTKLGFSIGGVPAIIFHEKNIKTFVDQRVINAEYVVGSGGTEHHGMKFSPLQFKKLGYIIAEIVKGEVIEVKNE